MVLVLASTVVGACATAPPAQNDEVPVRVVVVGDKQISIDFERMCRARVAMQAFAHDLERREQGAPDHVSTCIDATRRWWNADPVAILIESECISAHDDWREAKTCIEARQAHREGARDPDLAEPCEKMADGAATRGSETAPSERSLTRARLVGICIQTAHAIRSRDPRDYAERSRCILENDTRESSRACVASRPQR